MKSVYKSRRVISLLVMSLLLPAAALRAGAVESVRIIVKDDFEAGITVSPSHDFYGKQTGFRIHSEYPRLRALLGGTDPEGKAGIYEHRGEAAAGSKCIRIQNSATISQPFLPALSWWLHNEEVIEGGTLIISFDQYLSESFEGAFVLHFRAFKDPAGFSSHRQDSLTLTVHPKRVDLNQKQLPVRKGVWTRCELTLPLGSEITTATLTLSDAILGERRVETRLTRPQPGIDWIGMLLQGARDEYVLLDNLEIRVENEAPKPKLVRDTTPPPADVGEDSWGPAPAALLDVFPASTVTPVGPADRTTLNAAYYESGSTWLKDLDERVVFHREMKSEQGAKDSFALRIGKGGQIYSLRSAFGESVPPSFRSDGATSPWNDEVWQFVAICGKYNDTLFNRGTLSEEVRQRVEDSGFPRLHLFIHNSGAYMEGNLLSDLGNLYCPMLAAVPTADGRGYQTVNWGLIPWNTPHRSPLLYYVQTRDLGEGVIELTYVVHNFSVRDDVVFDWLNAPWGGTRYTSLPYHYMSRPNGELWDAKTFFVDMDGWNMPLNVRQTGGWNLSAAGEEADSPSLALVFGRDKYLEAEREKKKNGEPWIQDVESSYRGARAFSADEFRSQEIPYLPENEFRNYDVAVVIPKFKIRPGESITYRSFLVVNERDNAIAKAKELVDHVEYGLMTYDPVDTPMLTVEIGQDSAFELFSKPVPGSQPLFLIENATTGREIATTDMYKFFNKEKLDWNLPPEHPDAEYYNNGYAYRLELHNTKWKRLLGYGYKDRPAEGSYVQLSTILNKSHFPPADTYHLDLWVRTIRR